MKVLLAETLYPIKHKSLNFKLIDLISSFAEVTLVNANEYFGEYIQTNQKIKVANIQYEKPIKYEFYHFLYYLLYYVRLLCKFRPGHYDKIVFLSQRLDALSIVSLFIPKSKIVVFHHNDIDRMLSLRRETFLFKANINRIEHIVLADFIKDKITTTFNIDTKHIHVVYQPLINEVTVESLQKNARNSIIIGLGQGNNLNLINQIIEYDKSHNIDNIKMLLRNKILTYKSKCINVVTDNYSREEFEYHLFNDSTCLVLYPNNFQYRYSGIIDDALSHGMAVLCNNLPVGRYFASKYPKSCFVFNSIEELFEKASLILSGADVKDLELFLSHHSNAWVISQLKGSLSFE